MGSAASQARLAGLHGPHVRFPPVINTIHSSCWESRRRWLVTVRHCGSNGNELAVDPEGIRDAIHWCRRAPLDWCCSPRICWTRVSAVVKKYRAEMVRKTTFTFFTGTYQLRHRDIVTGLQIAELMQSSAALPPEHSCEFDFGSLYQPDTLLNRCTLLQTQSRSRKRAMVPLVSRRFSLATCFCVALLAYALGRIRV